MVNIANFVKYDLIIIFLLWITNKLIAPIIGIDVCNTVRIPNPENLLLLIDNKAQGIIIIIIIASQSLNVRC